MLVILIILLKYWLIRILYLLLFAIKNIIMKLQIIYFKIDKIYMFLFLNYSAYKGKFHFD